MMVDTVRTAGAGRCYVFTMLMGDLLTPVQEELFIKVVVLDNEQLGSGDRAESRGHDAAPYRTQESRFQCDCAGGRDMGSPC